MNRHPRALFWAMFAAAALQRDKTFAPNAAGAATDADALLDEFDKRFEWYSGGYGEFWKQRHRQPAKTKKVKA